MLAVIIAPHCFLRSGRGISKSVNTTGIEDEIFSGWMVRFLSQPDEYGWVSVMTHYGYQGYLSVYETKLLTEEEIRNYEARYTMRIGVGEADILDEPKVQGMPLITLPKSSLVNVISNTLEDGWCKVETADGQIGYTRTTYLRDRKEDDFFLFRDYGDSFFEDRQKEVLKKMTEQKNLSEEQIRCNIISSAMEYMGTQYRWGGKSSQGIDCSGLVFMSYLENGMLLYRDAGIKPGYPVKRIKKENLQPADLIFFPGHVALFLGKNRYIHATAYHKTPYVTINSLDAADEDYREDLVSKITAYGSVFV